MKDYTISVIVPTYNNEDTIERALMSVTCLTYHNWQIVVVNDCSDDKTTAIIQNKFVQFYGDKIKVVNNEVNVGVGKSRKIGVDNADGEFVIFLDSDDYLLPNCLEMSVKLQEQQDAEVVYTDTTIYVDENRVTNLGVPDCIMEGKISPTLHINMQKKWLTGKMFKTSLMKKVPMSPKRIGEDVNTLFFACYLATKVRSSSYSGYIHIYRPGSLIGIGDDRPFYYYCESTLCDIEMADFILEHEDMNVFNAFIQIPALNYKYHKQLIDNKQFASEKELNENYQRWNYIIDWFDKNEQLIKKYVKNY